MKFVILTDTHFVARGRKLYGLDPAERLAAAESWLDEQRAIWASRYENLDNLLSDPDLNGDKE